MIRNMHGTISASSAGACGIRPVQEHGFAKSQRRPPEPCARYVADEEHMLTAADQPRHCLEPWRDRLLSSRSLAASHETAAPPFRQTEWHKSSCGVAMAIALKWR